MTKKIILIGSVLFACLWLVGFVRWLPFLAQVFTSDASEYSRVATHLLQQGFYSLDGIAPYFSREPGMSIFLVPLFAVFGVENAVALFVAQGLLFFFSAWFFCNEVSHTFGQRIGAISFFLLLTHISVFHTIFSGYRECVALMMLITATAFLLRLERDPRIWTAVMAGVFLGAGILTYISFVFLPIALVAVLFLKKISWKYISVMAVMSYLVVSPWLMRNAMYGQRAVDEAQFRMTFVWYVRGEQAERVVGLEPLRCLWSEYISRNWNGRSDACSFNGLKNHLWPLGQPIGNEASIARAGKAKILAHPFSYLWFSMVDIIELHLPFVGGGWSTAYNVLAAAASAVLFVGFFFGLPAVLDRRTMLFSLLIAYNTAFFILTDATPRYLLPVIFSYVVFAAVGYDAVLRRLSSFYVRIHHRHTGV